MKIYDCFTFYNEFDLLEIRLEELYDKVDQFVIVESNQTFTNNKKPWNFELNKNRYVKYIDKITYIQVTDMPGSANPWDNEFHQRNAIVRGILDADSNDVIIVSDVDEIPRADSIDLLRNSEQLIFGLRMPLYNFKFNYMRKTPGQYDVWGMAARRSVFETITPNSLREMRFSLSNLPYQYVNDGCQLIEHAGWHFGYLGDIEYLKDKARSFSHQEINTPEFFAQLDIEASIAERKEWNRKESAQYEIVKLDNYFPAGVKNYANFILDDTEISSFDLLQQYPY